MKHYINAELQIVRMNNNDIVTTSVAVHGEPGNGQQLAPGRRKSIWD